MICSPFDLKDYLFGELEPEERKSVERHLSDCASCREELDMLGVTRSAVLCLREEEPPRRIAFVSDKVFEPRWWQKLLSTGPKLGFASAALLSAAIVFHAVHQPAPVTQQVAAAQTVDQKLIQAEIDKRVKAVVEEVVANSETRQTEKLLQVVNAQLSQYDRQYDIGLQSVKAYLDRERKLNAIRTRHALYEDTNGAFQ